MPEVLREKQPRTTRHLLFSYRMYKNVYVVVNLVAVRRKKGYGAKTEDTNGMSDGGSIS